MGNKITLGPFFTREHFSQPPIRGVAPLKLVMEWANAETAIRMPLFRRLFRYAPDRIRLESLVFRRRDFPADMECQAYQVVTTPEGKFLPLEALLAKLYTTGEISRPVFSVLNDLASQVPFEDSLTKPIDAQRLLVPQAENCGFRLNAVFQESGSIYAQVGWEPECRATRFHVGAIRFSPAADSGTKPANWVASDVIGVCQVLSEELRRLLPGNPVGLFTRAGLQLIRSQVLHSFQSVASEKA